MTPDWTRIRELFERALAIDPSERDRWLRERCPDEPEVVREVLDLLRHAGASEGVLDPTTTAAGNTPQERIGPYRLIQPVGAGGMGSVWLAEREGDFDQRVAIKLLRPDIVDGDAVPRFVRERQLLARLEHPGIARLIDGGTTAEGTPYLVLEYVDGLPIDAYVRRESLDLEATIALFLEVCDAVAAAHAGGIVHRDLKPANVLVPRSGRPKLLDFGIGRMVHETDDRALFVTGTGQRLMTPRYAAPEQIRGETITAAADVYGLGVLLYQLLTDRLPLGEGADTFADLERSILHDVPARPSTGSTRHPTQQVRGDLDIIVLRALHKDPRRRYADAAALAADLRRFQVGEPIAARPDSAAYRALKFVERHRVLVLATATVILGLSTGLGIAWNQYLEAEESRSLATDALTNAQRQQVIAEAVGEFLTEDLIGAADPERSHAGDLTMREAMSRAAAAIESRFADQPEVEAAVRQALGEAYLGLSLSDEAEPQLRRAHELRVDILGPDALSTFESARDLARALENLGRLDEAIALNLDLDARMKAAYGFKDGLRQIIASNLAHCLWSAGRMEEAEERYRELLELRREMFGDRHENTVTTYNLLATLYSEQGRHDEALPYAEKAATLRAELLGPHAPATLRAQGNLAALHYRLQRYDHALEQFQRVLAGQRESLGLTHRETVTTLNNLVVVATAAGQLDAVTESYRLQWESCRERGEAMSDAAQKAIDKYVDLGGKIGKAAEVSTQIEAWLSAESDASIRARLDAAREALHEKLREKPRESGA